MHLNKFRDATRRNPRNDVIPLSLSKFFFSFFSVNVGLIENIPQGQKGADQNNREHVPAGHLKDIFLATSLSATTAI